MVNNDLQKPSCKSGYKRNRSLTLNEINFIKAYARLGSYTAASREAYPNVKDAVDYGFTVATRPKVKKEIDKIKQGVLDEVDDAFVYNKFNDIYNKTAFKKIILTKKKIAEDQVYLEETEVDQTPIALNALKGLASFKRSAEQSMGNVNIQLNIDRSLLSDKDKKIIDVLNASPTNE